MFSNPDVDYTVIHKYHHQFFVFYNCLFPLVLQARCRRLNPQRFLLLRMRVTIFWFLIFFCHFKYFFHSWLFDTVCFIRCYVNVCDKAQYEKCLLTLSQLCLRWWGVCSSVPLSRRLWGWWPNVMTRPTPEDE